MKIQFPAKASTHDRKYQRLYLRIPKAAWVAYQLEQLVGRLIRVTIWEPGGKKPIVQFISQLRRPRDTGRFVTTMWTDLEPTYYIVTIEEPK